MYLWGEQFSRRYLAFEQWLRIFVNNQMFMSKARSDTLPFNYKQDIVVGIDTGAKRVPKQNLLMVSC